MIGQEDTIGPIEPVAAPAGAPAPEAQAAPSTEAIWGGKEYDSNNV